MFRLPVTPGCAGHLPGIDSPVETPRSRVVGVLTHASERCFETPALLNVNIPSLSIAKDTDLSTNRNTFLNVGFTFSGENLLFKCCPVVQYLEYND